MSLASILALTDFSTEGDRALERAAQIALHHDAQLRLMFVASTTNPSCLDPDTRLSQTATAMSTRLGLRVRCVGQGDMRLQNIAVQSRAADLLVVPRRSDRSPAAWFYGPDAIRYTRVCHCPVLVAGDALRGRLRQTVVAVDFTPASHHRAMFACLLDRDAQVELFHAVGPVGESQLRQADADIVRNARTSRMDQARINLAQMTQSLYAQAVPVESVASRGEPVQQILARQRWLGADLVVVGKSRRHPLVDMLLRSTAQQVLADTAADVLVVPHDYQMSATRVMPAESARRQFRSTTMA